MVILQGSIPAPGQYLQLSNTGCMGKGSEPVVLGSPPSVMPHPHLGLSAGLRSHYTMGGFAFIPLLQVKMFMMRHDMLFPDFSVFSDNLVVWGNFWCLSPPFPDCLRNELNKLLPIDFRRGECLLQKASLFCPLAQ